MSLSLVPVRSYASELEAEIGRATLEANGIDALVHRGDAAGLLRAVEPAELLVHSDDVDRARQVLDGEPFADQLPAMDESDEDEPPMFR